jgi:hypothetical protein
MSWRQEQDDIGGAQLDLESYLADLRAKFDTPSGVVCPGCGTGRLHPVGSLNENGRCDECAEAVNAFMEGR